MDAKLTQKIQRLIQPEALKKREPLLWSPGLGTDVWAMFCACIIGDREAVMRLVTQDPSLARSHYEYRTPLSFAVRENHVDVAAFLLDHGAEPFGVGGDLLKVARDRGYAEMERMLASKYNRIYGASAEGEALAVAIRKRDPETVRRLLEEHPELVNSGDGRSNQPIHWAVMTRQIDLIDELLSRGADINAKRGDGAHPIQLTNGDYHYRGWRDVPKEVAATPDDVFNHLVSRGAYVDAGMAAAKGNLSRVRELLDQDPGLANRVSDYNSYYEGCGSPLKNAAAAGHTEIVKLLLARGADPNLSQEGIAPHGHALYSAVYHGHFEIAKLLLEHGAHPNQPVESSADAVSIAVMNGNTRMLELLASYGAIWEIDMRPRGSLTYQEIVATKIGRSIKILAAYNDTASAARLFAGNPALANDREAFKNAAGHGHLEFVQLMLKYQPDLPKQVTISKPRAMAALLFEHGMDPNRPNWLRITPLHRFAERGDVESAALFIEHGADLNARDEEFCSTPLGWAARCAKIRMVEFLLRRGAKLSLPDDPPWAKPLAWATRRGHEGIVGMLAAFEQTGALPARSLNTFEALARDLVEAYDSGEDGAFGRVIEHFQLERPMMWDKPERSVRVARLRRCVRDQLRKDWASDEEAETLSLTDARFLVARSLGFENWAELANH